MRITHVFSTLQLSPLSLLKSESISFKRASESRLSVVKLFASSANDSFLFVSLFASFSNTYDERDGWLI
jgi:hypothetical protein